MLENEITLALPNGGTPANALFKRIDVVQNRSLYHGPGHSPIARNTLGFYRTPSKKVGNFLGVMKSSMKHTMDIQITNAVGETVTSPQIGELSFSIPVGATELSVDKTFDHLEALLESQRAVCKRTLFGPEI